MSTAPETAAPAAERDDAATPTPGVPAARPWVVWAVLIVAPVLGVLLLRAPLVNALLYRDPWFYTGYGWSLPHHVEVFGWFYYAVRFPVNLPIGWSQAVLGPVGGYLALRAIILIGTGALLYACLRRFASVPVALAGVVLMNLGAFYLRLLLWDYTTFVTLPASIGAVAAWHLGRERGRGLWSAAAAGALLAAAIFANALAGLIIPALFGVEAVAALRLGRRAVTTLLLRLVAGIVAAVATFWVGYLGYVAQLGWFDPYQLLKPTIDFLRSNDQLAAPFQIPARDWLAHEPRVYTPVIACLAIIAVGRRRMLGTDVPARVAQTAVAYTTIFWLYRKFLTSSVIETWWAYSMTAVTLALGLPVLLHWLTQDAHGRWRGPVAALLGGTAVADLVIRSDRGLAIDVYNGVRQHLALLLGLLAVAAVAIVALNVVRGRARWAAVAVTGAAIAFFGLVPAGYIGVGQTGEFSPFARAEVDGYAASSRMLDLMERYDQPDERLLLWSSLGGEADVGWANLPHQQGNIVNPEAPAASPNLDDGALALLRHPTTRRVLVLEESPVQVDAALGALRGRGFRDARVTQRGDWAGKRLQYAVIDLRGGAR